MIWSEVYAAAICINCHCQTHVEKRFEEGPGTEGADQNMPSSGHNTCLSKLRSENIYIRWVGHWREKNKNQQQKEEWRQREMMRWKEVTREVVPICYNDHKPFPNTQPNFYCRRLKSLVQNLPWCSNKAKLMSSRAEELPLTLQRMFPVTHLRSRFVHLHSRITDTLLSTRNRSCSY